MSAEPLSRYLHALQHELYLRFGRTEASWAVQQILAEVRGHLEDSFRDLLGAGAGEDEAARAAVARFGSPAVVADAYDRVDLERTSGGREQPTANRALRREHEARGRLADGSQASNAAFAVSGNNLGTGSSRRPPGERMEKETLMSALLRDARFAVRALVRAPGYTLAFVLTLGLGIGANTAIFSVVNGVLLQPLPYRDGHELMYLRQSAPLVGIDNTLFSVPEIIDVRNGVEAFDGVGEFSTLEFTVLGFDEPRRVTAGIVSGNYFDVMGLEAALGRVIDPGDDGEAGAVMVLTHDYWMRELGGSPDVVGLSLQMNGRSVTVVGVSAPAPPYPEETDIYVNLAASPHHLEATMQTDRAHRMTEVFARLAPESTVEAARRQLAQVAGRVYEGHPEFYDTSQGYSMALTPLQRQLGARAEAVFLLLLGAAGFVLLIACANVANLTLSRVLRRRAELAVRASLGAGRWALRRQLVMENLIPSLLGVFVGLLVARVGLDAMVRYAARYTARAGEISIDATVFGVTLAVGIGAACLFALLPRLPTAGVGDGRGNRATSGTAGRRVQRGLVVAQVAVCFVLLIGAGLLLQTLLNLNNADGGLELDTVLTISVPPTGTRNAEEARLFFDTISERVGELPGVSAVALGSRVPLVAPGGNSALLASIQFEIEDQPLEPGAAAPRADFRVVSGSYFDTLGMDIRQGRGFERSDTLDAAPAVIINESMAQRYFADRNPIGRRLRWLGGIVRFGFVSPDYRTIVGVVSDSNDFGISNPVPDVVFQASTQVDGVSALFVRSERPSAVARPAVDVILGLDPQQPVTRVATLAQVRADAIAPQRLNATLLAAFAALAVAIAAVGVAGVLAFSVSQRTRELGVRAALGADRNRLLTVVLGEGAAMTAAGLVIGGIAAAILSQLVSSLLFGIAPGDPGTYTAVGLMLLLVGLAAAAVPARRAARVDPIEALKGN